MTQRRAASTATQQHFKRGCNMGVLKKEDIVAYWVGEELLCPECYSKSNDTFDNVVEESDAERKDLILVCDKCGEVIWE
jgi:uncharacterized protein with PIN domain